MKQITEDFIQSNKLSVERYISETGFESHFRTKTRSSISTCIDYLNGLILLPYRKNIRKMAIFCCKHSNNQSLNHFLSNSSWSSAYLLKSVRTKTIKIIGKNGALILDESGIKKSGNYSVGVSRQYCGNQEKKKIARLVSSLHMSKKIRGC